MLNMLDEFTHESLTIRVAPTRFATDAPFGKVRALWSRNRWGRDRGTARATLGKGLAVSAFPLYVPV
jgi:hypothetical protein